MNKTQLKKIRAQQFNDDRAQRAKEMELRRAKRAAMGAKPTAATIMAIALMGKSILRK